MAYISQPCRNGRTVKVEIAEDETPAEAGARLRQLVAANGGPAGRKSRDQRLADRKRTQVQETDPRHELMRSMGRLECQACGAWINPTKDAAELHARKCSKKRVLC